MVGYGCLCMTLARFQGGDNIAVVPEVFGHMLKPQVLRELSALGLKRVDHSTGCS